MNKRTNILAVILLLALFATGCVSAVNYVAVKRNYWPDKVPDSQTVETAIWSIYNENITDMGINADDRILSVSPSGRYFLIVDAAKNYDIVERRPGNPIGSAARHVSQYTYQDGRFIRISRININPTTDPMWNDIVISSDSISVVWSPDESRILIAHSTMENRNIHNLRNMSANIYLINFACGYAVNLTGWHYVSEGMGDGGYLDFLPRWIDDSSFHFVRYKTDEYTWIIHLMSMNAETKNIEFLTDLSAYGRVALVLDYVIHGDAIYFSRFDVGDIHAGISHHDVSGFYVASLDGEYAKPNLLVSIVNMNMHRFSNDIIRVQVSQDGRWALLTVSDTRFLVADIPLADGYDLPYGPQPDPNEAMSIVFRDKWIPHHGVVLYDLYKNEIVNPFIDKQLRPDVVIVTGATFAPDGNSLLFSVFGSGGPWVWESFNTSTLYQVRLDDSSFDAVIILGHFGKRFG